MKISDYNIVERTSVEELENTVRELINDGYQPLGGMIVKPDSVKGDERIYCQTMVEYEGEFNESDAFSNLESKLYNIESAVNKLRRTVDSKD